MDPNLPTNIPSAVEMKDISEKLQDLGVGAAPTSSSDGDAGAAKVLDDATLRQGQGRDHNGPIVLLMVGMAGSGKTRLTQRLTAECMRRKSPPYVINLDPACRDPPYPVNIDIRDTVKYKKVMEVYNLGPNGAIVTSLNLFATKFNQVLALILSKKNSHRYVIIDTPGQIEVFMWSASGAIITETLAALFPTVLVYVTDLLSNKNPGTFISNMTYACSILYKTKLPLLLALNKRDLQDPQYAMNWITDFDTFDAALKERDDYSANLASSLALAMEEFYNVINFAVVSAEDGFGIDAFFNKVQEGVKDYETVYRPMYEKLQKDKLNAGEKRKKADLKKLKKDLGEGDDGNGGVFSRSGVDAGQGLSLRLGDAKDDEDTSSEDEDEKEKGSSKPSKPKTRPFQYETAMAEEEKRQIAKMDKHLSEQK